jgi:hypothetical protein
MRWRKEPRHKLVPLEDVRGVTGLDADEILRLGDTQRLVRIDGNGTREELIRIPIELLNTEPTEVEPLGRQERS